MQDLDQHEDDQKIIQHSQRPDRHSPVLQVFP